MIHRGKVAAVRSRSIRTERLPLSMFTLMSLTTLTRAVSVLCFAQKPDWNFSKIEFVFKYSDSCQKTSFSRILLRNMRFERGLKLFSMDGSRVLLLRRSLTMVILKVDGKMPVCKEWLIMFNNSPEKQV